MSKTIHEVADELRVALTEYIEATYHIGDPQLLAQRHNLLESLGVIHQAPYLESTPRYKAGAKFKDIADLSPYALELFETLSKPTAKGNQVLYDPPYKHQSDAIEHTVVEGSKTPNLLIMTGTGSGKTESFLMPIIGKLANEASSNPVAFENQSAMRALILYPMNALVNDQLGRLRAILGDERLVSLFKKWANRPPRFARYTSRTPYAGVRSKKNDQRKLKQFGDFYVDALQKSRSDNPLESQVAQQLIADLTKRGKWPAKPDLESWYLGPTKKGYWQDDSDAFIRAVTLDDDSELLTRHESQAAAPDLLVTNYSMLEYMLMRPVERTIFDQTRDWLNKNPREKFLLILDESHLYRGAGGAEVGLLLRRLRDRLDIPVERFRVICATASFESEEYAPQFASELTGVPPETFKIIGGEQLLRPNASPGSEKDADILAGLDMAGFYGQDTTARADSVRPFLEYLKVKPSVGAIDADLHEALSDFPPLSELVNTTMGRARTVEDLGTSIFPHSDKTTADTALTNLAALATNARLRTDDPSLLPCRVHSFFRGLRGLWICMDSECTEIPPELRGVAGKLYTQPRDQCDCLARVLEFYTCRVCGAAYARGYCENPERPTIVWAEPGATLEMANGTAEALSPLDMLLTQPGQLDQVEGVTFDLHTGQINPVQRGARDRTVFLPAHRIAKAVHDDEEDQGTYMAEAGVFHECGICERKSYQGRSSVQDHETKGDQPFQVLLTQQLQVQPPGPQPATRFAPLRGRKVLAFSDSRQVAARLAPNLQMYSSRDSLRPLMVRGWTRLAQIPNFQLNLADLYFAVLIAANELDVRLRPELSLQETFTDYTTTAEKVQAGLLHDDDALKEQCYEVRAGDGAPEALLGDILSTMSDRSLGLEALAIASIVERSDKHAKLATLPSIPGVAETPDDKVALTRAWLREWGTAGFWLPSMGVRWYRIHPDRKVRITPRSGKFKKLERLLGSPAAKKVFHDKWVPELLKTFAELVEKDKYRLLGKFLSLELGGEWVRCADCKSVHRPLRLIPRCLDCGHQSVFPLDPDKDEVFLKRKGYYRKGVKAVLGENPEAPMAIIAAEHTAQLNSAQNEDVFSKAEQNELLFQDVELPGESEKTARSAIDVLSSTTTMEVGIDIGQLSGVALRNMPPSRANYQQRAGRAGRRGNAIATVVAFGGSDTHDEHFFAKPAEMISGEVVDPTLSLDNVDIAKRHVRAFLLQSYHQAKIPDISTLTNARGDLFSVLGPVSDFLLPDSILSRTGFKLWLAENAEKLRHRVSEWIPRELSISDRDELLSGMIQDCLSAIDDALYEAEEPTVPQVVDEEGQSMEIQDETGEEKPPRSPNTRSLLDTLLYKGVLPRYAFPTDVATFHVFDMGRSTRFRPIMEFSPAQGLAVALSQYAPGKQIWIAGKCYTSGAIYSPDPKERKLQWDSRRLHLECTQCGHAFTRELNLDLSVNQRIDCEACQGDKTMGPARYWFRPTGFAHPVDVSVVTSPDDIPETSYATRAKLTMRSPEEPAWTRLSDRIRFLTARTPLLVSNTGPSRAGYSYCTKCGRIEASTTQPSTVKGSHSKPFPDEKNQYCSGTHVAEDVVLGTDFITDVALFSLRLELPVRLNATDSITLVAVRTLSEALSRAATDLLGIEAGEVLAEFRPAVTARGIQGLETEIFLYDTLSGGAGFAREAAKKGLELFQKALEIMSDCKERCDMSCYRCLRSFRNRIDHAALDRHTGIALAEYLLTGALQPFNEQRLRKATGLLFSDLIRQESLRPVLSQVPDVIDDLGKRHLSPILGTAKNGKAFLFSVSSPLAEPAPPRLLDVQVGGIAGVTLVEISELMVRKNLPDASHQVAHQL